MILYTGKTYNKSYLKEEGRSDLSSNPKNIIFNKSSLTFNRYKHFHYNKSLFELGNIPLDTLLECINKITTILDKYVNDVSPFSPGLKKLFIHDLVQERDVIAENRRKIGKELVLKFNVDRLCENAIKYKLNGNELDLNKFNITTIPHEPETDKNFLNTLDSKRNRSEKGKPSKQRPKSDGKKVRSVKKGDQIIDSSNLNYYLKYFNYLKLYYQYYLNHFVSVYIFYKSFSSGSRNDTNGSLVHIRDGERTVYILGKLFVYFRKLAILHLKCLINLLPLSFVYNPDNFINYNGLVDYNDIIYCEMNSLGDLDSGLRLELKRSLFDCVEINRKFDLEEFNNFLKVNNLNNVALGHEKPFSANISTNILSNNSSNILSNNSVAHTPRVDTGHPNVAFHYGIDPRIYPGNITNFATVIHSSPLYPVNPSVTPGLTKKSINLLDSNSNFNPNSFRHGNTRFNMVPSLTSAGNKTTIGPAITPTVRVETKPYNIPPTTSGATMVTYTTGATNANDGFTVTSCDSGKDNSTSNNNHSDGRQIDISNNDLKYDSTYDGRYDPKYCDKHDDGYYGKHDDGYHDKHYVKYEHSKSDIRYGDRYNEGKYDSKYHESKFDLRHHTSKHEDRKYNDRHDVKHDERRYSDSKYTDTKYEDHRHCDTRYNESRYRDDNSRYSGDSRSCSSSSRYSDSNRHTDDRSHSCDNRYGDTVRQSYGNDRYGGDRRYYSLHDSTYTDDRYYDGRYSDRRSVSHSTQSSHSSAGSYHRSDTNSRSERRTHHPSFTRSSSNGNSCSSYSTSRGYSSQTSQQNLPVKRELEYQIPPQPSSRVDPPVSSNHGTDTKNMKLDDAEKERLGKELKSGKKLKSSTKFNTMNIREIFNSLTSKNQPASATTTVSDNHPDYKSTVHSDKTGSKDGSDAIGSNIATSCSATNMIIDATTTSSKGIGDSSINSVVIDATSSSKGIDNSASNSMVIDTPTTISKGIDESTAMKHMGEGIINNSAETIGGKADDPPPSSMQSHTDNIK